MLPITDRSESHASLRLSPPIPPSTLRARHRCVPPASRSSLAITGSRPFPSQFSSDIPLVRPPSPSSIDPPMPSPTAALARRCRPISITALFASLLGLILCRNCSLFSLVALIFLFSLWLRETSVPPPVPAFDLASPSSPSHLHPHLCINLPPHHQMSSRPCPSLPALHSSSSLIALCIHDRPAPPV